MISRRQFLMQASCALGSACALPYLHAELGSVLDEFRYGTVKLAPGPAEEQFQHTQAVLLQMNVDSLLKPWRLRAGQPAPGPDMGGWYDEVPLGRTPSQGQGFAPGHAFGQWISALARGYGIRRDSRNLARVRQILDLYGPAISPSFYANFRFPAYDYDKVVCGLTDASLYCNLDQDRSLLHRTTDAAIQHLPPRALGRDGSQLQWRRSVGENATDDYGWDESYTMPENLFLAWRHGSGDRYRTLATRYLLDETYFDPLAAGKNVLAGHHAYSFCNALSSAMQAYLSMGSQKHFDAARNGFDMITAQSFATGGWGPDESFCAPGSGDLYRSLTKTHHSFETPCGSYAHFKLTRYLLRVTRDGRYGDSMERVLYNTVLGAKPLQNDGSAFYYSDYNYQGSRFYFDDKWPCCSGTLPQVAADYHVLIYFRDSRGIYVNLYMPSEVNWVTNDGAQFTLRQTGNYPADGQVRLDLRGTRKSRFALQLRIPGWAQQAGGASIQVNDSRVVNKLTGGFASIEREWRDGDKVELNLPMPVALEAIDNEHRNTVALLRGPLVLFPLADNPRLTRDQLLRVQRDKNGKWQAGGVSFVPFTDIRDEKYSTYLNLI